MYLHLIKHFSILHGDHVGQDKCTVFLAKMGKGQELAERICSRSAQWGKQNTNHTRTQYRHRFSAFMSYINEITRGTH